MTSLPTLQTRKSASILLFLLTAGLLVTVFLLLLMTAVIYSRDNVLQRIDGFSRADILMPNTAIETFTRVRKPEKPQLDQQIAPPLPQVSHDIPKPQQLTPQLMLQLQAADFASDFRVNMGAFAYADGEHLPLIKVAPIYPRRALMLGLEGRVLVEFSVNADGSVMNPKVLVAEPEGIFERAALQAVMNFKYQPRTVDGEAIVVHGVKNSFIFVLESPEFTQ